MSTIDELEKIQNTIYKSKQEYNVAYAEYSAKINEILNKPQNPSSEKEEIQILDQNQKDKLPEALKDALKPETKESPNDPNTTKIPNIIKDTQTIPDKNIITISPEKTPAPTPNHTIILPHLNNLIPAPPLPIGSLIPDPNKFEKIKTENPEKTQNKPNSQIELMSSIIRPIKPTAPSNPFHPNNFDSKSRKTQLLKIVNQFAIEKCFIRPEARELSNFLTDFFLLNNFVYDSFEESLPEILKAVKTLCKKKKRAIEVLKAFPENDAFCKKIEDIFTFDKCDQMIKSAKKKLKIIGSKILKILEKTATPNWETSIETVKEILAESDYIFKIKVTNFSRKLKQCLDIRSICKILRKIHNKRTLEIKFLEETKRKVISLIEEGSMEVEFNSDNSLNQMKRDHLLMVLGNSQVARLLTNVLEKLDTENLTKATNEQNQSLEDINAMEGKRKQEKLQMLRNITLQDLEYKQFQAKIANAVSGEFKTRKIPFINFKLLGENSEASMVKQVVEAYFQRKSQSLESKTQQKVNLFHYLDYKKETAQYFRKNKGIQFSFKPKPISNVEKLFSIAMSLKKDAKIDYFLFNTFAKASDILPIKKQQALIGKRSKLSENHEILGMMFSDEYQQLAFREDDWLNSLEYVFKKISELDVSEISYSEPTRQNNSSSQKRKESVSTVQKSELGQMELVESHPEQFEMETPEGVLILPDSKYCGPLLCASKKPNDIIKRISEKIEKITEILDNVNMMAMLYDLESRRSGLKQTMREADLKKIKDFVYNYEWAINNNILKFSQKRNEQLLKVHNNLRYLLNTINTFIVNMDDQPVKPSKGPNGKVQSFEDFMKKVDSKQTGWINLWQMDNNKKDYNKCLKKFVKIKTHKHVFPEKINMIKMYLRSHKDLRKDIKEFTLSLKLETQKDEVLYRAIKEKYWEFRHRFIQTPFYSEELHAVLSQFELVYMLFSIYNEPVSLKNLVGFENLLRETGYDKLKISACGIFMDQEIEKLSSQLKKIERCFAIAQSGVFFGSQPRDFDMVDFQSCGIVLKDSLDIDSYIGGNKESIVSEDKTLQVKKLPTCRMVYLVNAISHISVLVKQALSFRESFQFNCTVERYARLLFTIYRKLSLESDRTFCKLFGPEYKDDIFRELSLQSELKKKLDAPIQAWKALNILSHRVANGFYNKTFSCSSLDRFLVQQQISNCWFNSEFYKKKVEAFLRAQSLIFLMKRTVLSKLYLKLIQSKQCGNNGEGESEKYVSVFDEENDNFCRQDVLKTIYIFTDLKSRHWNPRSSKKQDSRLKSQFDNKWNIKEGLKYELVNQYLLLFDPVTYMDKDSQHNMNKSNEGETAKIRDYLAQIQHKYMKYPNMKLMFQRLVRRPEFFEEDKAICLFLMVFSLMVDLMSDKGKFELSFMDLTIYLKEVSNVFKKVKKRKYEEFDSVFNEKKIKQEQEKNKDKEEEIKEESKGNEEDKEKKVMGDIKEEDEEDQMNEIKQSLKNSLMKLGVVKKESITEETSLNVTTGMKLLVYVLEALRQVHVRVRNKIKAKLKDGSTLTGENEIQREDDPISETVCGIFNVNVIESKINITHTYTSLKEKLSNLEKKHSKYAENKEYKETLTDPMEDMAIPGVISWNKVLPKLDNLSFSSVYDSIANPDLNNQLRTLIETPENLFESIKILTRLFNDIREMNFMQDNKQLKKILNKIKVPARTLLSKDLEKDHSKMLYLKNQKEDVNGSNNVRIGNLVKPSGPQNRVEMKNYLDSIIKGNAGSDYEEDSKIHGIFNDEVLKKHMILDKDTQEIVNKLKKREVSLSDIGKMDMLKIPKRDLKDYEDWKLNSAELAQILETRVNGNKYLETEFINGKQTAPAISCLIRKMKNNSSSYKAGQVLKIEYGLAKMKKLGNLLTKLMDEEIIFDEFARRFEKFYLKVKKKREKGGEKKKKKPKHVEPKNKDNLLDDICQEIGFTNEFKNEYVPQPKSDIMGTNFTERGPLIHSGDVLKLKIFSSSKLGFLQESNDQDNQYFSTRCEYFFSGDSRLLQLFRGIKVHPQIRQKKRKDRATIIQSLLINPLYSKQNDFDLTNSENTLFGKQEEVFRNQFMKCGEVMITGWTMINDDSFVNKLNLLFENNKFMANKLTNHMVFYLGKPKLKGSIKEITEELWNFWGVCPIQNFSSEEVEFVPIDFSNLFVFCLKRKIGTPSKSTEQPTPDIESLKAQLLEGLIKGDIPESSPEKEPADPTPFKRQSLTKKKLFSIHSEVLESDRIEAYNVLENSVRYYLDKPSPEITKPQMNFNPVTKPLEPMPMNFQPVTQQYLGKRDNDILGAVQELPSDSIFKGLTKRPTQIVPPTLKTPALPTLDLGIAMPKSKVESKESVVKEGETEQGLTGFDSLIDLIRDVNVEDLKEIYDSLDDPDMKGMLLKAAEKFYPNDKNPLRFIR